ncbi:hypothetical protein D3C80_2080550 [compost metagenome]
MTTVCGILIQPHPAVVGELLVGLSETGRRSYLAVQPLAAMLITHSIERSKLFRGKFAPLFDDGIEGR